MKDRNSGLLSQVMTRMRTASTGHVTRQETTWANELARKITHTYHKVCDIKNDNIQEGRGVVREYVGQAKARDRSEIDR